ncbi:MAG: hypothetical protein RBT65_09825 [Methanolobus sp.]|nr:hypothetical protein [Methanolobus sp.]
MFTNTWKHFVLMLLLGILAWAFAFLGKAQGFGYFPNIAAFMITVWVEYRQWSLSKKPFMVLLKQHWLDSLIDILAGNAGFFIGYNLLLRLFAGGWIV